MYPFIENKIHEVSGVCTETSELVGGSYVATKTADEHQYSAAAPKPRARAVILVS
jgi:hypothetical protein